MGWLNLGPQSEQNRLIVWHVLAGGVVALALLLAHGAHQLGWGPLRGLVEGAWNGCGVADRVAQGRS